MKEFKMTAIGVALLTLVSVLFMMACPQEPAVPPPAKSNEALLTAITVSGEDAAIEIPAPVFGSDWDETGVANMDASDITVNSVQGTTVSVTKSPRATVTFAVKSGALSGTGAITKPDEYLDFEEEVPELPAAPAGYNQYVFLFVRVQAENVNYVNFYLFRFVERSGDVRINRVGLSSGATEAGFTGISANAANPDLAATVSAAATANVSLPGGTGAVTVTVNKAQSGSVIEFQYAQATGIVLPTFGSDTSFTFEDGDFLYIEATAVNGSKGYYKIEIQIGRNANLASVTVGTTPQTDAAYLGTGRSTWSDFTTATIGNFTTDPAGLDAATLALAAVSEDSAATVQYAMRDEAGGTLSEPVWQNLTSGTTLSVPGITARTYLYIKVTSVSTTNPVSLFYKMKLIVPKTGKILYGVPLLDDPNGTAGEFYIDPIWDSNELDEFDISRVNLAETTADYFKEEWGQHTRATAKALWDDEGIWVFVDVKFNQYRTSATGELQDRPISTGGTYQEDSVEIFVNERLQYLATAATADLGNQFRVGVENQKSGRAAPGSNLAPFTDTGYTKTRTRTIPSGNTEQDQGGYQVIAHVPFKFKSDTNAGDVFDPDGLVKDGALVGFELQLNTALTDGARDGILTWNGVNSRAYQNARGYGTVTLALDGRSRAKVAEAPVITVVNLANARYDLDDDADDVTALEVSATGTGTLGYQWYKADSATSLGDPISGAEDASYKPLTGEVGTFYYYVVVTNTDTSADPGHQTATATSARAQIRIRDTNAATAPAITINFNEVSLTGVGATVTPAEDGTGYTIEYGSSAYGNVFARFDVTLPVGYDISQYSTVTFTYQGISGDINGKGLRLLAVPGGSGLSGWSNDASVGENPKDGGNVIVNAQIVSGTDEQNFILDLNDRKEELSSATSVRFSFYIHASSTSGDAATSYAISNVKFE